MNMDTETWTWTQTPTNIYFDFTSNSGNAVGTAGAIAPPQKEESILVGRALTMETILCLIKPHNFDMTVCMFSFNLEWWF